jgi:hypothetical protein
MFMQNEHHQLEYHNSPQDSVTVSIVDYWHVQCLDYRTVSFLEFSSSFLYIFDKHMKIQSINDHFAYFRAIGK